ALSPGVDDRLPRGAPGVGLQDRQPERRLGVRLRVELPGGRGRSARCRRRLRHLRPLSTPLKVAVVGSGPAGFYAADALLKSEDPLVEVDVIDRLPTPHGLVRPGVAPAHSNTKPASPRV